MKMELILKNNRNAKMKIKLLKMKKMMMISISVKLTSSMPSKSMKNKLQALKMAKNQETCHLAKLKEKFPTQKQD